MVHLARDPRFLASASFLAMLFFVAAFGPLIAPYPGDPVNATQQLQGPSAEHLLGTDEFGRDILTRIILGARLTVEVGTGSVLIAASIGTVLGMLAGYFGGTAELVAMRLIDAVVSFPPFLVAIFVITFLGSDLVTLVTTIGFIFVPQYARLAHVTALAAKEKEYVDAARAIGARASRIIARAIVPNVFAPLIIQMSLGIGSAVLVESGLSFLGLGPPPPATTWGRSIQQSARFMTLNPHAIIWPSLAISLTVLSLNILGDSLRDNLDPRLRRL